MRPNDVKYENELYECFECGQRLTDVDGRKCADCGGELRHLGRPRDL